MINCQPTNVRCIDCMQIVTKNGPICKPNIQPSLRLLNQESNDS